MNSIGNDLRNVKINLALNSVIVISINANINNEYEIDVFSGLFSKTSWKIIRLLERVANYLGGSHYKIIRMAVDVL